MSVVALLAPDLALGLSVRVVRLLGLPSPSVPLISALLTAVLSVVRLLQGSLLPLSALTAIPSSRLLVLRPLPGVLLPWRLVSASLISSAAVASASLAAVLGVLAPVAGLVDRELVAAPLSAGSLAAAPTGVRSPIAGLSAARLAGRTVPAIASGPLALSAALASAVRIAAREVLAVPRPPLSFLPVVLRSAVLLAALPPAALAPARLSVPVAVGRRSLLPTAHVALLLASFGSAFATGSAALFAALVRVFALAAPLTSLTPLSRHLRLVRPALVAPAIVDLRRLVAARSLAAAIDAAVAIDVSLAVVFLPAVLALALGAPTAPVVLVVLRVAAVRAIFRTGIVVWHSSSTESARRDNGPNRSERFSDERKRSASREVREGCSYAPGGVDDGDPRDAVSPARE
ncbi:hypothetical protein GCM10009020_15550 [Natronoarchaeum mannanilyticum]|uniref:Uncharacterized protein n=1 Tax=Natronoarchaeum mannanilyticum TaxID=926360 RepID=A0AAV3TAU9_9EURY